VKPYAAYCASHERSITLVKDAANGKNAKNQEFAQVFLFVVVKV
jgi:hypothetical protein